MRSPVPSRSASRSPTGISRSPPSRPRAPRQRQSTRPAAYTHAGRHRADSRTCRQGTAACPRRGRGGSRWLLDRPGQAGTGTGRGRGRSGLPAAQECRGRECRASLTTKRLGPMIASTGLRTCSRSPPGMSFFSTGCRLLPWGLLTPCGGSTDANYPKSGLSRGVYRPYY